ncbi:hypothetical protein F5X68DRAFT_214790 [Plectosphaerella plurivora]|uniref:Anaphase-promoting complex, subunit CDC26 n=1 Tax=Plectosphaerella plurivora TaxID=936078 RepID=A0A9P9A7R6_9PEZI|nr:hypothetical protein F5X68DRAFT_214790 [Plectosphaerella plurivora]
MLRRPATVLSVTSEDVAAYEDRRAREAHAMAERERAVTAAHNKRHLQVLQMQLQQAQQSSDPSPRQRQDYAQHDMFAQQARMEPTPGVASSPAEYQRMAQQQQHIFNTQQAHGHGMPPPNARGLQQRLAAAAASQGEDDYTEQDTEMLVGSSDEEGGMEDSSMLAAGDGSVRGRGVRRGQGPAVGGAGRGHQLQLTPTPAMGIMDAGRGRSRDERITGARRGRGPG